MQILNMNIMKHFLGGNIMKYQTMKYQTMTYKILTFLLILCLFFSNLLNTQIHAHATEKQDNYNNKLMFQDEKDSYVSGDEVILYNAMQVSGRIF